MEITCKNNQPIRILQNILKKLQTISSIKEAFKLTRDLNHTQSMTQRIAKKMQISIDIQNRPMNGWLRKKSRLIWVMKIFATRKGRRPEVRL
jgi:hypothetical protein